ncbi:MAG: hypothetical protein M1138_03920 [Candidatus Thermoplasmatota archaeon]|jgi:hypothetical protein|nr:hypothetical protein [Candidatus Thermoplasmatota archaeon]
MAFQDTDPFFSRELLAMLLAYLVFIGYFQKPDFYGLTLSQVYLSSLSSFYFLVPLLYASETAGLFARSLEKGSFGFLMTMPVKRNLLLWIYVLVAALVSALIFWIPAVLLEWYIFPGFDVLLAIYILLLLTGFILLYISAGYLIATVTSNSVITSLLVLAFFFLASVYSVKYLASNSYIEFLFSGFTEFSSNPVLNYSTFVAVIISFALSAVMLASAPLVLKRRGVRSGR